MSDETATSATGLPIGLNLDEYKGAFCHGENKEVRLNVLHQFINQFIETLCNQSSTSSDSAGSVHLSVTNRSTLSEKGKGFPNVHSQHKRRLLKRNLLILFGVIISCLAIVGLVAVAGTYLTEEDKNIYAFSGQFKVDETFNSKMAESDSKEFQGFKKRFCANIESALINNVSALLCEINNLSPGSIIVNFTLVIKPLGSLSADETHNLLTSLLHGTQVGVMAVDPGRTHFAANISRNVTGLSLKTPKASSCSFDALPIMHLTYTFPNYCGDYQVCIEGKVVLKKCRQGEEFAFTSSGDTVICAPPSNATYCGKKQEEIQTTTSSAASTTSRATSDIHVSTLSTTTTTTSADWPPVFTCPSTGIVFLPAHDTYPDNCGKYQECINGRPENRTCAEGAHFVYELPIKACAQPIDPETFCNKMKKLS